MKRALTAYEDTNMYGGAHTTNAKIASKAAREGRWLIVSDPAYTSATFRVVLCRQ